MRSNGRESWYRWAIVCAPGRAASRSTGVLRSLRTMALLAALALGACGGSHGGAAAPADDVPPDGMFAVGTREIVLVDESRPTSANGDVPARDSRTLETLVFYPGVGEPGGVARRDLTPVPEAGPFPLVVFAHGLGGVAAVYGDLLTAIAAAGYVVAAPNFPLTNGLTEGEPLRDDYVNQPADMGFVLDAAIGLNGDSSSFLAGMIDVDRIGAAGQSLGGVTTFGWAFNTCCADPRIQAAVPMAGALFEFPGEYFREPGPPVLIIHGDADDTVPYANAEMAFSLAQPPKLLVRLVGGDHIRPYVNVGQRRPTFDATVAATIAFFDHFLKRERGSLDRLLAVDDLEAADLEGQLE